MLAQNPAPIAAPRPVAALVPSISPPPTKPKSSSGTGFTEHIVRIDETWETIAAARGLTVDDVRSANPGIDCHVGRRLLLPPTPQIISAATLPDKKPKSAPLALPENDPNNAIVRYAPNPDNLPPTVIAPPAIAPTVRIGGPVKANAVAPASTSRVHVVAKGETVFSIAKRHRISEKSLMKINSIADASKLRPGQKLKVPSAN